MAVVVGWVMVYSICLREGAVNGIWWGVGVGVVGSFRVIRLFLPACPSIQPE
jgi:hypothetical protein